MTAHGSPSMRLARLRDLLAQHVDSGFVPGAEVVFARHGEVHVEATGTLAFEGEGSRVPMARDTIAYWLIGLMLLAGASGFLYAWFNSRSRVNQRQRRRELAAHEKVMTKKDVP